MTATAPIVNSISFDQAVYAPGALITATVNITPGAQTPILGTPLTVTATDPVTGLVGTLTAMFSVASGPASDVTVPAASDPSPRKWTLVSWLAPLAVFTATA